MLRIQIGRRKRGTKRVQLESSCMKYQNIIRMPGKPTRKKTAIIDRELQRYNIDIS